MKIPRRAAGAAAGRWTFVGVFNASNVLNYAFLLAMSRALSGDDFALFAALFGAVYLASALANTLMTSTASAVAADPVSATAIVRRGARNMIMFGVPLALAVAIAAKPAGTFLQTSDYASIALAGVSLWLLMIASVGYGGLQGSERFGLLGAALIAAAAGRVALGVIFVGLGMGIDGAMLAVTLGLAASAAVALAPFARRTMLSVGRIAVIPSARVSMLPALVASIAIAIPTSADVVLVRHYFSSQDAAAFAAVSTLGKIVVFGPMAISLALFPSMVRAHAEGALGPAALRRVVSATAAVALPSAVAILAAWFIVPRLVFSDYEVPLPLIACYLGAMLAFALVVSLLYFALARRQMALIGAVLAGLATELAVAVAWHPTTAAVAAVLLAGNIALLAGIGWRCLAACPKTAHAPERAPLSREERAAA